LNDSGNLTINTVNPIVNFVTAGCRKQSRSDERPVIAYSAPDNYMKTVNTSIIKVCKHN